MLRLKSKKEVLQEYESRYPELDNYFMNELSKEYDRYAELLKDCETKEEAYKIFNSLEMERLKYFRGAHEIKARQFERWIDKDTKEFRKGIEKTKKHRPT